MARLASDTLGVPRPASEKPRPARNSRRRARASAEHADTADDDDSQLSSGATARSRQGFVSRPRLVRRLLDESRAPTAVICAPPGYGKTTLLVEWAARDERPFAWVTLSEQHRHSATLFEGIVEALHELEPVDAGLLRRCRKAASERVGPSPGALAALTTTLSSMGVERRPAVLVLDNAHVPRSRATARVLSAVADATPPCSKLALASRSEPVLSTGRLRAGHALFELSQRDLALTCYEAHRLLRAAGLDIDRDAVEQLVTRTEGWPAALYLAALSLRSEDDVAVAVEHFGGTDRAISEYVRQELLDPLAKELRTFLTRSSMLDQLSPRLCDDVLERSDSASVLETLAFHELMLLPLDTTNKWYRCHSLVRDMLRDEFQTREPDRATSVSARASDWFEQRGDIDRAIDHAALAGDSERVGGLLWSHASEFFTRGHDPRVGRWLSSFPDESVARSPRLALCAASAALLAPDLSGAERWVGAAANALALEDADAPQTLAGGVAMVRAASGRDGLRRMGRVAGQAGSLLGSESPWSGFCWLLQGVADHVAGERAKARSELTVGAGSSAMPMAQCLCLAQLAIMDGEDAAWDRAADRLTNASELVSTSWLGDEPHAALVFAVSAWIAGRRGRGDEAKRDLTRAIHVLDHFDGFMPWYEVETRLVIARASIGLADVLSARASLSRASRVLRRLPDAPGFHAWLDDGWAEIDEHGASALAGPASLTIAELRILRFLPTHLSFREIGERLHVSTNTVKTQAHSVYGKLGAASRSQAVAEASALGLIEAAVV